jgi:hypothetical protein
MMTNVFELSDRLIECGITRIQIARSAGRSLGHVCMVLNGQRHMSKYLAEVIADLIPIEAVKGGFLGVWPVPFHLGFSLHCGDGPSGKGDRYERCTTKNCLAQTGQRY